MQQTKVINREEERTHQQYPLHPYPSPYQQHVYPWVFSAMPSFLGINSFFLYFVGGGWIPLRELSRIPNGKRSFINASMREGFADLESQVFLGEKSGFVGR